MSYSVTHYCTAIFGSLKPSGVGSPVGSKTCSSSSSRAHCTGSIFIYASKTLLLSWFKVAGGRIKEGVIVRVCSPTTQCVQMKPDKV